jgi:hypothetical protein
VVDAAQLLAALEQRDELGVLVEVDGHVARVPEGTPAQSP